MKKLILILPILSLCLLQSCSNPSKEAVKFGEKLSQALLVDDQAAVRQLCPFLTGMDKVAFPFDASSVQATMTPDKKIKASYNHSIKMTLEKQADGSYAATESWGLLEYDPADLEFSTWMGLVNPQENDALNALRIGDKDFTSYMLTAVSPKKAHPLVMGKEVVTQGPEFMFDDGFGSYTVYNSSHLSVPGSEYHVDFPVIYVHTFQVVSHYSEPGKDISPNGSAVYNFTFSMTSRPYNPKIIYNVSEMELLRKYYAPQGTEYDEFSATNGRPLANRPQNAPFGNKAISGVIGPSRIKGTADFSREDGTFTASYGYAGYTSGILLQGRFRADGRFTATERTLKENKVCGYYSGKIEGNVLSGTFFNYAGSQYSFNVTLQ